MYHRRSNNVCCGFFFQSELASLFPKVTIIPILVTILSVVLQSGLAVWHMMALLILMLCLLLVLKILFVTVSYITVVLFIAFAFNALTLLVVWHLACECWYADSGDRTGGRCK